MRTSRRPFAALSRMGTCVAPFLRSQGFVVPIEGAFAANGSPVVYSKGVPHGNAEEVMRQLRAKDPGAEVDVTHDSKGKYVLNKISFNGHLFVCPVVVNPYSDVKEIVKTATYKCLCC